MRVKELAKILAESIKSEVEVMSETDVEYIDRLENIIEELENQVYLLRSTK